MAAHKWQIIIQIQNTVAARVAAACGKTEQAAAEPVQALCRSPEETLRFASPEMEEYSGIMRRDIQIVDLLFVQ